MEEIGHCMTRVLVLVVSVFVLVIALFAMSSEDGAGAGAATTYVPPMFLSHGGGPCFFMENEGMMEGMGKGSDVAEWMKRVIGEEYAPEVRAAIKAVVVVSAHWETREEIGVYRVDGPNTLLFDYSGFPPHTYKLAYPAPGAPDVADRVGELLEAAGFGVAMESARGLDHGVFVPLILALPDADLPVLQVSIHSSYDPELHLSLGEALHTLTKEGVLVIGSGFATHGVSNAEETDAFVGWLTHTLTSSDLTPEDRRRLLAAWEVEAPFARRAHRREDHLMPVFVAAGAAGFSPARLVQDHVWLLPSNAGSMASYAWTPSPSYT